MLMESKMKDSFMMNDWIEVKTVIDVNIPLDNNYIMCGMIISIGCPKFGLNFDDITGIKLGSLVWFKKSSATEFHHGTFIIKEKDIIKIEFELEVEKMEDKLK